MASKNQLLVILDSKRNQNIIIEVSPALISAADALTVRGTGPRRLLHNCHCYVCAGWLGKTIASTAVVESGLQ